MAFPKNSCSILDTKEKYVDPALAGLIPLKRVELPEELIGIKVNIYYLYQKEVPGDKPSPPQRKYRWEKVYPVRTAKLISAYATGSNERDILHFFFELDDDEFNNVINPEKFFGEQNQNKYATILPTSKLPLDQKEQVLKYSQREISDKFDLDHFTTFDGKKYYPLFFYIDGIRNRSGEYLQPKSDLLSMSTYYQFKEGEKYVFDFTTFFSKNPKEYKISLKVDEKAFVKNENEMILNTRYDVRNWILVVSSIERNMWSYLNFEITDVEGQQGKSPLALPIKIRFNIEIKRFMTARVIEVFADIGFVVGTGFIALSKLVTNLDNNNMFWWIVGLSYLISIIGKILGKFWKG